MFSKIVLLSLLTGSVLFSAPARNIERSFKSSDGSVFQARTFGNQHLNWIETKDGEILKYNRESKNFEYAKIKDSNLVASGAIYQHNNSKRARSLAHINKVDKKELYELWVKKRKEDSLRKSFKSDL